MPLGQFARIVALLGTLAGVGLAAAAVFRGWRAGRPRVAPRAAERQLGPGESRVLRVVFDLPKGRTAPLLSAKEGVPPETEIEGVLLGGADSALHRPVLLALAPSPVR